MSLHVLDCDDRALCKQERWFQGVSFDRLADGLHRLDRMTMCPSCKRKAIVRLKKAFKMLCPMSKLAK